MRPRLLVTGGYGFVGSAFVARAHPEYELVLVARARRAAEDVVWDLSEAAPTRMPPVDHVVHIAGLTAKQHDDATSAEEYRRHNIAATHNLLASLQTRPSYVLYVSTADVYGQSGKRPITEETATAPETVYAETKLEGERTAAAYCAEHEVPLGIARLGSIYGPGEAAYRKVVPSFVSLAVAGKTLTILGEGRAQRHLLYVDDLARALLLMVERRAPGVFNLVGATATTVGDLARTVVELSGGRSSVVHRPYDGAETDVLFENSKLSGLGFAECVPLREGLQREIDWYRAAAGASRDAHPA